MRAKTSNPNGRLCPDDEIAAAEAAIQGHIDRIAKRHEEKVLRGVAAMLAPYDTVDRSELPDLVPAAGSAGRTRPAWERAYDSAARTYGWDEETRKWRTPQHDHEAVQFIRAVADH